MGWFDFQGLPNGYCGQTGCFEPTIAQTKTNEVLFVVTSVGLLSALVAVFVGMGHLSILFKTGLNSFIYLLMAISVVHYNRVRSSLPQID